MKTKRLIACLFTVVCSTAGTLRSQMAATSELRVHLGFSQTGKHRAVPAVIWLEPLAGTPALTFIPHETYTLLQKNRTFIPHLQVIPVGAVVQFPNADPFFHNVFSLYDGKRFDLGLYEAGSSKSVTFAREGVSYIFCNIHPEMSAVVLALPSSLFAIADRNDFFALRNIPRGDYKLHFWIEGVPQSVVNDLTRSVHFSAGTVDLGSLAIPTQPSGTAAHANKFGNEYDPRPGSPYNQ
jgi:plastocyanin